MAFTYRDFVELLTSEPETKPEDNKPEELIDEEGDVFERIRGC